jgi:hypothetical protein
VPSQRRYWHRTDRPGSGSRARLEAAANPWIAALGLLLLSLAVLPLGRVNAIAGVSSFGG